MRTTIDKAGRVIVPKKLREAHGMRAGTNLEIDSDRLGEIRIRIQDAEPSLQTINGVVVHHGDTVGEKIDIVDFINQQRDQDARRQAYQDNP